MNRSIAKTAMATAIGLITATSAALADQAPGDIQHQSAMTKLERGTARFADNTWMESKAVARTVVHSPAIAYQVVRGERPLFPTASRERTSSHEQIALTGHRTQSKAQLNSSAHHNEPPPI